MALPTCAVQQVGGYLGYTGRGAEKKKNDANSKADLKLKCTGIQDLRSGIQVETGSAIVQWTPSASMANVVCASN
jgi:hypothetical protein